MLVEFGDWVRVSATELLDATAAQPRVPLISAVGDTENLFATRRRLLFGCISADLIDSLRALKKCG
jgi:hypothetical protein